MKNVIFLPILLILSACNLDAALRQNINPTQYTSSTMEPTYFAGRVTKSEPDAKGVVKYTGPGISYSMGTNAKMHAFKGVDGNVKYVLEARLEYVSNGLRYYNKVSDSAGTSLEMKRVRAGEVGGCSGNTCYQAETVHITLDEAYLNENKFDDLLLSVSRTNKRKRKQDTMSIIAQALDMSGSQQKQTTDNFELVIPTFYIKEFLKAIKSS